MQKAFGFDVNKCTGCEACQVACTLENGVAPGISWRRVFTFNPRGIPGVPSFHHSLACNHCEDPPCLNHCPALAYSKNPETGAVNVETDRCVGCRYCSWVCPFDAPRFNASAGVVEKCTLCAHRLEEGLTPACAEACPTGALTVIDLDGGDDPSRRDDRATGFVESAARPAFRFVHSHETRRVPETSAGAGGTRSGAGRSDPPGTGRIRLGSEWTLVVFTLVEAFLVGAFWAHLPAGGADPFGGWRPPLPALVVAGLAVTGLSALHLGKPARAWRAILNIRRSWLSREAVLVPLFFAAVAYVWLVGAGYWVAGALGVAALVATDRLYHATGAPGAVWHSAQTLPTAVLVWGLLSGNAVLFGAVCSLKTISYLARNVRRRRGGRTPLAWTTRFRVLAGLAAPLVLWWHGSPALYPLAVALVVAGETVDRIEFYLDLDLPSPARQMALDLRRFGTETGG